VVATLVARNRAMTRKVVEAAHICASRLAHVGPTRSRPAQGRFMTGAGGRYLGRNRRRAR
jgi:hypothetical protein